MINEGNINFSYLFVLIITEQILFFLLFFLSKVDTTSVNTLTGSVRFFDIFVTTFARRVELFYHHVDRDV